MTNYSLDDFIGESEEEHVQKLRDQCENLPKTKQAEFLLHKLKTDPILARHAHFARVVKR